MKHLRIIDDLDILLGVMPEEIAEAVRKARKNDSLLEVIMDLGRVPTARFVDEEIDLIKREIEQQDIHYVVGRIGQFNDDNRAGLERTLHRIAAIRNRTGDIVGLTCRVGRAVYGTLDIIQDLIESGKNILLLGQPGVGKTTMLREAARVLSDNKRVVVVDTSNEIGGDGDVPHPAVGKARRMQVAKPSLQHEVMIEAVENHYPQVIVIDEIGRELEALAARTIAERGVQLIGTAHGYTLENILLNPTLSDLVGGIDSVTLSDEEARRRNTQKTVLERRSPPTFDMLIELQTRDQVAVHRDVAGAVDALLRGYPLIPEIRIRNESGEIAVERPPAQSSLRGTSPGGLRRQNGGGKGSEYNGISSTRENGFVAPATSETYLSRSGITPIHIYPYGVARNRLIQAAKRLGVPAVIVDDVTQAETLVTLRTYYRKRQHTVMDAERRGMPIYVLRANTINQMQTYLNELFGMNAMEERSDEEDSALEETQSAIQAVLNGEAWVDLTPANPYVRRQQHEMARRAKLISQSLGKDPYRRVRIYRE